MRQNHILLLTTLFSTTSLLWFLLNPPCSDVNLEADSKGYNDLEGNPVAEIRVPGMVPEKAAVQKELPFEEEQRRRAAVVEAQCSRGASKTSYGSVMNFVVADTSQSILYCPVYKAASSSWLIALLDMRGLWQATFTAQDLNRIRKSVYKPMKNFKPGEQESVFHTRFLVVRHPFERLLSCYRDKFKEANKPYYFKTYGKKMLLLYRDVDKSYSKAQITNLLAKAEMDPERERTLGNPFANPVGPTFSEFVQYVVSRSSDDEHWRPYHQHCAPCSLHYNFILKFENLPKEGNEFLQHLQSKPDVRQRRENVYSGPPTTEVVCSYYSQLDRDLFGKLIQKYQPDFDLFEYSPDAYLSCADEYVKQ